MPAPVKLYHESPVRNRRSILRNGLDPRKDKTGWKVVWLSTEKPVDSFCDVWQADTTGLNVTQHDGEDTWYWAHEIICPDRVVLLSQGII